ncbi:MAG: hypothetical protein II265_05060 [Clostridia bacterium]|nr:hypothetical protein [Clostridia bacterium]
MVNEILTASGIEYRQAWFPRLPANTCAVYFDDVEMDGPDPVTPLTSDGLPCVVHHDILVEMYEPKQDPAAEAALEAAIRATGLTFKKYDRVWLQSLQRYQVNYEFNYTTKT